MAMPITTAADHAEIYGDNDHWKHVMESLFVPAVEAAGYEAVRPVVTGSFMIHQAIIANLEKCDLVLVDLSGHNPNVFFELGVRTSLDRPIALVSDGKLRLPFDTAGMNTHEYDPTLSGWEIDEQRKKLANHLTESYESCDGRNPLWHMFGLTQRAQEPEISETPTEAKIDLLAAQMDEIQSALATVVRGVAESQTPLWSRNIPTSVTPTERTRPSTNSQRANSLIAEHLNAILPDAQIDWHRAANGNQVRISLDRPLSATERQLVNEALDLYPRGSEVEMVLDAPETGASPEDLAVKDVRMAARRAAQRSMATGAERARRPPTPPRPTTGRTAGNNDGDMR